MLNFKHCIGIANSTGVEFDVADNNDNVVADNADILVDDNTDIVVAVNTDNTPFSLVFFSSKNKLISHIDLKSGTPNNNWISEVTSCRSLLLLSSASFNAFSGEKLHLIAKFHF